MERVHRLESIVNLLHTRARNSQSQQHQGPVDISRSDELNEDKDGPYTTDLPIEPGLSGHEPSTNLSALGVMVGEEQGKLYVGDPFWASLQHEVRLFLTHFK